MTDISDKKTISAYNRVALRFSKIKSTRIPWGKDLKVLARFLKGKRVVDIGCGPGVETNILARSGYDALGIDASKAMIDLAKRHYKRGNFKVMNFYDLHLPRGYFDGFVAIASLLHIPKSRLPKVLKNIIRILVPGGIGFISIKEKGKVSEKLIKEQQYGKVIERFFAFYKAAEFVQYLKASGFTISKRYKKLENNKDRTVWLCYFVKKGK